jgi:hypothetical protein
MMKIAAVTCYVLILKLRCLQAVEYRWSWFTCYSALELLHLVCISELLLIKAEVQVFTAKLILQLGTCSFANRLIVLGSKYLHWDRRFEVVTPIRRPGKQSKQFRCCGNLLYADM